MNITECFLEFSGKSKILGNRPLEACFPFLDNAHNDYRSVEKTGKIKKIFVISGYGGYYGSGYGGHAYGGYGKPHYGGSYQKNYHGGGYGGQHKYGCGPEYGGNIY